MADMGWTARTATAAGTAAGMGAAQLGLGYGLGVVVWPAVPTPDDSAWLGSLGWATWITASATVFGAVIASRLGGAAAVRSRGPWRLGLAVAAGLGALVAVALIALPARDAVRQDTFSPHLIAGGYALIGLALGIVVAYWAVVSRAVAANLVGTAVWLWTLAITAVVVELALHRESATYLTSWQFAEATAGGRYGTVYWPSALLTVAAAFLIGALAAAPAARRGEFALGAATSGAVGPLLVAASFMALAPRLTGALGALESAYLIAPYAVLAGLGGSAVTVATTQAAGNRRARRAVGHAARNDAFDAVATVPAGDPSEFQARSAKPKTKATTSAGRARVPAQQPPAAGAEPAEQPDPEPDQKPRTKAAKQRGARPAEQPGGTEPTKQRGARPAEQPGTETVRQPGGTEPAKRGAKAAEPPGAEIAGPPGTETTEQPRAGFGRFGWRRAATSRGGADAAGDPLATEVNQPPADAPPATSFLGRFRAQRRSEPTDSPAPDAASATTGKSASAAKTRATAPAVAAKAGPDDPGPASPAPADEPPAPARRNFFARRGQTRTDPTSPSSEASAPDASGKAGTSTGPSGKPSTGTGSGPFGSADATPNPAANAGASSSRAARSGSTPAPAAPGAGRNPDPTGTADATRNPAGPGGVRAKSTGSGGNGGRSSAAPTPSALNRPPVAPDPITGPATAPKPMNPPRSSGHPAGGRAPSGTPAGAAAPRAGGPPANAGRDARGDKAGRDARDARADADTAEVARGRGRKAATPTPRSTVTPPPASPPVARINPPHRPPDTR
jgi:hypothetical protein